MASNYPGAQYLRPSWSPLRTTPTHIQQGHSWLEPPGTQLSKIGQALAERAALAMVIDMASAKIGYYTYIQEGGKFRMG